MLVAGLRGATLLTQQGKRGICGGVIVGVDDWPSSKKATVGLRNGGGLMLLDAVMTESFFFWHAIVEMHTWHGGHYRDHMGPSNLAGVGVTGLDCHQ
jgi:hypothetical protein